MSEVFYGRGYVYLLKYHIVWCTKYRQKVLHGNVEARLKEIILDIAEANNVIIEEMVTDIDHIHLLANCSPQHYIPSMLKALKGLTYSHD